MMPSATLHTAGRASRTAQTATITSTQVTNYVYDAANRLTSVNGQAYTWDDNGNLVNDGNTVYAYDQANRLISATLGVTTTQYAYNGDGARLKQVVNGSPTTYTLDLAAPLVQVLVAKDSSGDTRYLYGVTRVGEQQSAGWVYHLSDVLGSVRQLADANAQVVLARGYTPYGEPLWTQGTGHSEYGFTGEDVDSYIKLLFLRARYYSLETARFLSKDVWQGDYTRPQSFNGWAYVEGNPVSNVDPTGNSKCGIFTEPAECQVLGQLLHDRAAAIKTSVQSGALLPVEGFAQLADYATTDLFEYDLVDVMWGMTSVLYGFDWNHHMFLWWTAYQGLPPDSPYFIGQDWLPYKQYYPANPVSGHAYSERGDWNSIYWDDTANQAYHTWFYASVTYLDGASWAYLADQYHDPYWNGETQWDISEEDHNLALKGIELGRLVSDDALWGNCSAIYPELVFKIGAWIRANLKGG
jgi:RHS repeat-associated protein